MLTLERMVAHLLTDILECKKRELAVLKANAARFQMLKDKEPRFVLRARDDSTHGRQWVYVQDATRKYAGMASNRNMNRYTHHLWHATWFTQAEIDALVRLGVTPIPVEDVVVQYKTHADEVAPLWDLIEPPHEWDTLKVRRDADAIFGEPTV